MATPKDQPQGLLIYCSLDRLVGLRNTLNTLINMGVPVGKDGHVQMGGVRFVFLNDRKEAVDAWAFAKLAAAGMESASYAGGDEPPDGEPTDPEGG